MQSTPDNSGATLHPIPEKGEQYHENGSVLVEGPDADAEATADVPVPAQQTGEDIIPDGGLLAWLQVLASWLLFFNSWYGTPPFCLLYCRTLYQVQQLHKKGLFTN